MDDVIVREEAPEDFRAIDVVNLSAFEGEDEARFVTAMRQAAGYIPELALVAEVNGRIVGHIMLSAVTMVNGSGERRVLALAPMSVVPSQSHRGIGSALVRAALAKAGSLGYPGIIVVGQPDFYKRAGFSPAAKWKIRCTLPVPDDAITAMELVAGAFSGGGMVHYPQLFAELYAKAQR